MKYTAGQLASIASKLRDIPAIEKPKQELSKQTAVTVLARGIASLRKNGYTLVQLAEALRGEGLDIATPTLKNYLQRTKRASKNAAKSPAKKTADTPLPHRPASIRALRDWRFQPIRVAVMRRLLWPRSGGAP